jgi:hypothetical protein
LAIFAFPHFRMKFISPLTIAFLLFISFSCKKDHTVLGVDVQPEGDLLNAQFSDTSRIYAYSKLADSIVSFNTKFKFLGCNEDPYFGRTEIGLYTNANITKTDLKFGTRAKIQSAEIVIALDDNFEFFGNETAALSFSVFTLDSVLSTKRNYFTSNNRLHSSSSLIGVSTSTYVNGTKKVLRIPVDNSFAQKLLTDTAYLASNQTLLSKYKGFYIKPSNVSGSAGVIFKCDLDSDLSGLFFKYDSDSLNTKDSIQTFQFIFSGDNAVKFNTVKKDLQQADPNFKAQINGDTTAGALNLFVKGMGFSKVRIYIPGIARYADSSRISINRAEVVLYGDPLYSFVGNAPAPRLTLLPLDSLGRQIYSQDQLSFTDYTRYDGSYDRDAHKYVFNIARHVQAIANKQVKNYGFDLVVANSDQTLSSPILAQLYILTNPSMAVRRDEYNNRTVFYGTGRSSKRPMFNISYVRIK